MNLVDLGIEGDGDLDTMRVWEYSYVSLSSLSGVPTYYDPYKLSAERLIE